MAVHVCYNISLYISLTSSAQKQQVPRIFGERKKMAASFSSFHWELNAGVTNLA